MANLLWLAWQTWRIAQEETRGDAGQSLFATFRQGVITNLLNPKAAVFYVTVLPGFLPPAPGLTQTVVFSAIYVAIASLVHAAIVIAAGSAQAVLSNPDRVQTARRVMALGLVGVAVWVYLRT